LNNFAPSRSLLVDHKNRLPDKSTKKTLLPRVQKSKPNEKNQLNRCKSILVQRRAASPVTITTRVEPREICCKSEEETKVC
jgi:hypothetical protein